MKSARHPRYARHRFPAEVISYAVWLYFRFPLSLRMVEEMLAARGILVSHETVRQWALKFGQTFANRIRRRLPAAGDKCDPPPLKWSTLKRAGSGNLDSEISGVSA
jgi:putative transposase